MNKKGLVTPGVIVLIGITIITTMGVTRTYDNGKLKKNGQLIWCKMQNKCAEYCDSLYK